MPGRICRTRMSQAEYRRVSTDFIELFRKFGLARFWHEAAWGCHPRRRIAMSRSFFASVLSLALAAFALASTPADAKSRIKDIVAFEGVRDNQLVGYGIVVGLNGSGDSLRNAPMTKQSLEAMLERQGVNVRDGNLNTKNTAAVMVTANLP